jgi:hypothetical protein
MHRIYIDVPYAQKDEAKLLGARWDAEVRRWYITDKQDVLLFSKWFGGTVQTKPLVHGDRITLKDFLRDNYGTAVSLTFRSARAFGIPYPLESGWAKKYADRTALRSSVTVGKKAKPAKAVKPAKVHAAKLAINDPVAFVPLCNCTTPPWEDCEHTDALSQSAMAEMLA